MSVVDSASLSSEDRPVGLRTRPDLVVQESVFQGETCWIVKDPLAMKYFRLRRPEYLVLKRLEQVTSYHEIKLLLLRSFPESITRIESVQQLVISLHRNGLLITDSQGQAFPLRKRRNREVRQKLLGLASSLISLRFPGYDPERILQWFYPKVRWCFTPWFALIVGLTCLSAVTLVAMNLESFLAKLPDFQSFFAFDNILFMAFILIFTKSIHELGHGLMCKHYGGECHQIGFMLLVMTPAMYCDTSDSWTLPNRWHRMAIGAAGMYVELFIAAICTFVWWFTNPGWIHYLALNIMFLSSVSTVIFNANPLLRYDGYYILSDFLEIPNLAQKSKTALVSKLRVWCLGLKPVNPRQLPERAHFVFALYSVASFVYRWLVVLMIFFLVTDIFEPWGLAPVAHLIIAISLFGMLVVPMYKMTKFFLTPGKLREVKKQKLYVTLTLLALMAAFICLFQFPHYVWASFVVRPIDPHRVILNQSGVLRQVSAREGQSVQAGDEIAELENKALEIEMEELRGMLARRKNDLSEYQRMQSIQFNSGSRIAETLAQIRTLENQIEVKDHQLKELVVRAKRSGILLAPPNVPFKNIPEPTLQSWSETPLTPANMGCFLESNTLVGLIGNPREMEAVLVVDQSDVKLLAAGQEVVVLSEQFPSTFINTRLTFVSQDELSAVPRELSQTNGGPIPIKPDANGQERPILKSYEAYAQFDVSELENKQIQFLPGMRGQARIRVGSASLASRFRRFISKIINFR